MSETADDLVKRFTEQDKAHAFEWLREYALRDDNAQDSGYAYIMTLEIDRLHKALARRDALLRRWLAYISDGTDATIRKDTERELEGSGIRVFLERKP